MGGIVESRLAAIREAEGGPVDTAADRELAAAINERIRADLDACARRLDAGEPVRPDAVIILLANRLLAADQDRPAVLTAVERDAIIAFGVQAIGECVEILRAEMLAAAGEPRH